MNLRGYPGTTRIPTCEDTLTVKGKTVRKKIPCFSDSKGRKRLGGKSGHGLHGQPGRRHVARPLRMATWRLALHDLRARRASLHRTSRSSGHLDRMTRTLVPLRPQT